MYANSIIEISRQALRNNHNFIKKLIGPDVQFCSVIKGNAYGHGIKEFLRLAQDEGTDYFTVYTAEEAHAACEELWKGSRIMIMGYMDKEAMEWAIRQKFEFFVSDIPSLERAVEICVKLTIPAGIHIELETGMYRTGILKEDIPDMIRMLRRHKDLFNIKGICTHLAGAEQMNNKDRIKKQMENYEQMLRRFVAEGLAPEKRHIACSAGALNFPGSTLDMARIGILQYGLWPNEETHFRYLEKHHENNHPLRRLISWKSKIAYLKNVPTGEYIGYGTSFMANKDMLIAIIPIGYAQGYTRSLSNYGQVLIHGTKLPIIGIINMNLISVDVTDLKEVALEDEVVLIGNQGEREITIASFGEMTNQLNYELLTRLPENIPRKIVD